jgi:hypothetical protein
MTMKWPWNRRDERGSDGTAARIEATESLREAHERWPEVLKVAASLREVRERNHFGDRVRIIYQGRDR